MSLIASLTICHYFRLRLMLYYALCFTLLYYAFSSQLIKQAILITLPMYYYSFYVNARSFIALQKILDYALCFTMLYALLYIIMLFCTAVLLRCL